jgi:hypothetical protein
MKLTIEIANPLEVEQLLTVFKTLNLESIRVIVDKTTVGAPIARKNKVKKDVLNSISRPIKPHLDLEALKKEKNYTGVNKPRFFALIKEIDIMEPIELLMSQLSR